MTEITVTLADEAFSALRRSHEEFAREMRLAAAIHWYERGDASQAKAAEIAGLDRTGFLSTLVRSPWSKRETRQRYPVASRLLSNSHSLA